MHWTNPATDVISVATISLVSLVAILGLVCIYRSLCFRFRLQRSGFLQLSYFNGPWAARIALILVEIYWGFGEILRLRFLNGRERFFSSPLWQMDVCKFYVLSSLGFAEPSMFLMLAFLLHAAMQRRELGTLSQRWNIKMIGSVLLFSFPALIWQLAVVFVAPKLDKEGSRRLKMAKFFTSTSALAHGSVACTYPLLSTIFLGAFYVILIIYITYIGSRILSSVINKGLRIRIYMLMFSVFLFLPLRALLLGFSVLPQPGTSAYEVIVFLAFLVLLFCALVGIIVLVYFPVTDTLALRDPEHIEMEGLVYHDYY